MTDTDGPDHRLYQLALDRRQTENARRAFATGMKRCAQALGYGGAETCPWLSLTYLDLEAMQAGLKARDALNVRDVRPPERTDKTGTED